MTVKAIKELIESTGLKTAYYQYPVNSAPPIPYTVYYFPRTEDFQADSINYAHINALNVELYTKEKDFNTEALLESAFKNAEISYRKSETYLESEKMYEVLYEMEVLING